MGVEYPPQRLALQGVVQQGQGLSGVVAVAGVDQHRALAGQAVQHDVVG